MSVNKKGKLVDEIPSEVPKEVPKFVVDEFEKLKKKEKGLTWWSDDRYFAIEYNISATQKGQLLVYDLDKNKFETGPKSNSTENELKQMAWEINYGTNKNRLEFFRNIRTKLNK